MEGWIKLHRQLLNSDIWLIDKPYDERSAWIYLLLMANHEDKNVILGSEVVMVKRGSFITSEIKLVERWKWSRTKVRSFLRLLEKDGMIIKKTDSRKTTITIVKYSDFQLSRTTEKQEKNSLKTVEEQHLIHKQERKNEKNERIYTNSANQQSEELFEKLWKLYPNKKGKAKITKATKLKLLEIGYDEIARAVERYNQELDKDSDWRKIQNGSTFFNSGYVDYLDSNYVPGEHGQNKRKRNDFNNFSQREYDEQELENYFLKETEKIGRSDSG